MADNKPKYSHSDKDYLKSIKEQNGIAFYWPYDGFKIYNFIKAMIYWHIIMIIGPTIQIFYDFKLYR